MQRRRFADTSQLHHSIPTNIKYANRKKNIFYDDSLFILYLAPRICFSMYYSVYSFHITRFDGVPVLFLPGNSGSHMQARSLASVALRKALSSERDYHFDYFTSKMEYVYLSQNNNHKQVFIKI